MRNEDLWDVRICMLQCEEAIFTTMLLRIDNVSKRVHMLYENTVAFPSHGDSMQFHSHLLSSTVKQERGCFSGQRSHFLAENFPGPA